MNRFAIVLDGESISAPSVSAAIPGGQAQISGSFTQKSATELANVLKYGALPLAFDVSEVSNVSATLGGEQLQRRHHRRHHRPDPGRRCFCFALLPRARHRRRRLAGDRRASSPTRAWCCSAARSGFALNLPGIAGAIVAIGVTADSFVIYFERIRDEVRDGRSLRTAVETGWRRARQTVLIADAVSMLSALILFILAIGSVKGFAFTLGLTTADRRAGGVLLHQAADDAAGPDPVLRRRAPALRARPRPPRGQGPARGPRRGATTAAAPRPTDGPTSEGGLMSRFGDLGHRLYTGEVSYDFIGRRRRWYILSAVLIADLAAGACSSAG